MKEVVFDQIKNLYNDNYSTYLQFKRYDDRFYDFFEDKTFIIITQESMKLGILPNILYILENNNMEICAMKNYNYIDEFKLIELYKYHKTYFSKANEVHPYSNVIPSVGWPVLRERFNGPSVCLLLKNNKHSIIKDFLKLKGDKNPSNCHDNQIRFSSPNTVLSLVHSSDDEFSVMRESLLFFGEEKIRFLINNNVSSHNSILKFLKLKSQIEHLTICNQSQVLFKFIFNIFQNIIDDTEDRRYFQFIDSFFKIYQNDFNVNTDILNFILTNVSNDFHKVLIEILFCNRGITPEEFTIYSQFIKNNIFVDGSIEKLILQGLVTEKYWIINFGDNEKV